jgi:HK97 family phage portal protein
MSILGGLWNKRSLPLTDAKPWQEMSEGWFGSSHSGIHVSTEGSLKYAAVYACVRILAGTIAQLPLLVYQRRPGGQGRDRATNFYLYDLLHNQPNPVMTSFHFRTAMQGHLALWGNAYAEIEWTNGGRVKALWPLRPDKVEGVAMNATADGLVYSYRLPSNRLVQLPQRKVLHLRFMSPDGIMGYSPIRLHRQGIGLALAAEEFGARFFGNDARPGMVLQHPGVLSDTAHQHLKESWEAEHGGLSKAHRMAILEEGMSLQEIGIPPEDAQYLQVRSFQRTEVYGIYGIPPHMAGDVERSTSWGTGIEQQGIGFLVHTMGPWLASWEQGLDASLMTEAERQRYYAEFLVEGLLRGDSAARSQFYQAMFNMGAFSPNDIRQRENENPVEGGDTRFVPLNMVPLDQAALVQEMKAIEDERADRRALPEPEPDKEARAIQAAYSRQRLQRAHMRIYADVAARVLRREANDVGNAARRMLQQRDMAQFEEWLADFYEEFRGVVAANMRPVAQAYADLVLADVLGEVGGDPIAEERVTRFIEEYLLSQGGRHAARSEKKIRDILADGGENLLERIETELELWRGQERAQSIALEESVRTGNAVARFAYVALGTLMLRSAAVGSSCPFCRGLDGRVISIEEPFLKAGQPFQPEGAEAPLTVTKNKKHPPYHAGCDCQVVAG